MDRTPNGLATLALLKTRFDQGRDHLEFLEPFVADAAHRASSEAFVPADIVEIIRSRHGLLLPSDTVKTILGRFARRKQLRREGGRFLDPTVPDPSLEGARAEEMDRLAQLGQAFSDFAAREEHELDRDSALGLLASFVSLNKIPLVLKEALPDSPLDRHELDRASLRLTARFIVERCLAEQYLADALQRLTEGMVLQDALLLRDISAPPERFRGLTIVLDTPILLSALDLHGRADGVATREFLALVREAGGVTIAFDRTINEIRRILAVYEERLGTPGGRLRLHPTELTHHVLSERLDASDVRVISATLEKRLSQIAIPVRGLPDRDRRYTLDEEALAAALADDSGSTDRPRIRHDVNAIASTLTLRRGRTATTIERCRALFCTTSGRVIRNAQMWYREQGERGVPPIVHQYALSSIAWFKRPRAAAEVKLHELAALCSAALRPTRETWERFIDNLERLRADGAISDDEAVTVVANELTEPLLARIDDSGEPDADSIRDVIDRVRARLKAEAAKESVDAIRTAEARAEKARRTASEAQTRYLRLEATAARRSQRVGQLVANLVGGSLGLITVVAVPLAFADISGLQSSTLKWIARATLLAAAGLAAYSQISGPSIRAIRDRLGDLIAAQMLRLLVPHQEQQALPGGVSPRKHIQGLRQDD